MKKQLELGCGGSDRTWAGYENYATDIVEMGRPNFKQADLILEPIPWEDNYFDLITADDFLEHMPMVLYLYMPPMFLANERTAKPPPKAGVVRRDIMVNLFNEIYRVLNHGGLFYSHTPVYPSRTIFQDPQHVAFWTEETPHYFSGDYYGFHDHYGHTSRFELVSKQVVADHMNFTLRAIKNVPKEALYTLKYP